MWNSEFVTSGVNLFITIVAVLIALAAALSFLDVDKLKRAEFLKKKEDKKAQASKEAWVQKDS